MLPSEGCEDCLSVDTGDTDLKTPCASTHTTPLTQARAPLLKHHSSVSENNASGNGHILFPHNLAALPLHQTSLQNDAADHCINSPTAGRELFSCENNILGYGTLQVKKTKANIEVIMKSTSDGNIAQL